MFAKLIEKDGRQALALVETDDLGFVGIRVCAEYPTGNMAFVFHGFGMEETDSTAVWDESVEELKKLSDEDIWAMADHAAAVMSPLTDNYVDAKQIQIARMERFMRNMPDEDKRFLQLADRIAEEFNLDVTDADDFEKLSALGEDDISLEDLEFLRRKVAEYEEQRHTPG